MTASMAELVAEVFRLPKGQPEVVRAVEPDFEDGLFVAGEVFRWDPEARAYLNGAGSVAILASAVRVGLGSFFVEVLDVAAPVHP